MMESDNILQDQEAMNKQKKGLMITMLKRRFEDRLYVYLNKADFQDMESLDQWLDKALAQYLVECDAVKAYYDSKLDT